MDERDAIVAMTYAVVIFSIIVQGLTVGRLTEHFVGAAIRANVAPPSLPSESDG
jgi:NhaP-type Na+/H+ or K+/H+ antiporter